MSGTTVANPAIDFGPLILGGLFAFGLSGCVNMQFVVYWQLYSGEPWSTKSLAVATWFLDLCHSTFIAVAVWNSVIPPYNNANLVDVIPWSVPLAVELTAMLTFLEQSFFAHRIYRVQNRKLAVAGPVFILAFLRIGTASATVAEMLKKKTYLAFVYPHPSVIFILATLGLCLSALVDIIIMVSLCYFLRSNRSDIPMSSTNRIIDNLTMWTVETGSATCLGAIASLICLTAMPQNRVFLGLHFVVGKLYANCLLATLNSRSKIRLPRRDNSGSRLMPVSVFPGGPFRHHEERHGPGSPGLQRQFPMHVDAFEPQPINWKRDPPEIKVNVQRMVESKYDDDGEVI